MDKKRLDKIKKLIKIKNEFRAKNQPHVNPDRDAYFSEFAEYAPRNGIDDFPIGPEELQPADGTEASGESSTIFEAQPDVPTTYSNVPDIDTEHSGSEISRKNCFLTHGSISINDECNLLCTYCYRPAAHKKQAIPLAAGKAAIDFLFKHSGSHLSVNFFGGEPLLAFDRIEHLVIYARDKGIQEKKSISFSVNTNGTILNKKIALFLRQHRVGIVLSLDGIPEANDHHRKTFDGTGSYHLLEKNIPLLLEEPRQVHVRMTVTPETVHYMFKNVEFIYDKGFRSAAVAIDRTDENWDEEKKKIFHEQYRQITEWYIEILKNNKPFKLVDLDFGSVSLSYPLAQNKLPCSAGLNGISISMEGRIYPCYRFTGIREAEIGDIFEGINEKRRNYFTKTSFFDNPKCRNCELSYRCHRCPWLSYIKTSSYNTILEINCFEGKVMLEMFRILRDAMEKSESKTYNKRKNDIENRFFGGSTSL
jgi:uncharacterized protein